MANTVITKELQDYLINNPKTKVVYFDAQGRHYFNVFQLTTGEKKDTGNGEHVALFGKGVFSHRRIIPGEWNVDELKEDVCKGDPLTKIVHEMTSEDVIAYEVKESPDALLSQISGMDENQKLSLLSALLPKSAIEKLGLTGTSETAKATPSPVEDEEIPT